MSIDLQHPLILVVDDSESNRYLLRSALVQHNYQIIEAASGSETMSRLARFPDLIIMDVSLPDVNGFELCYKLKNSPEHSRIPIILTSALFVHEDDFMKGVNSGADAYLTAPLLPHVVLSTVRAWLNVRLAEIEREKIKDELTRSFEQSRENLYEFFMQAPQPMVILEGPRHFFKLANPPYEKMIGRKAQGKSLMEVFTSEEVSHFVPLLNGVLETGISYIGKELPLSIADDHGQVHDLWVDIGYHPFRDSQQKIKGILAIVQDVTRQTNDRKTIETLMSKVSVQKAKLESIVANAPAGIAIMTGAEIRFEQINAEFARLVGPREYIGRTYNEVYPELADSHHPSSIRAVLETGIPYEAAEEKVTVVAKSGNLEEQYFDFSYIRIDAEDGTPYGVFCHAMNVTDKVLDREKLRQMVGRLEQERELRERFVATLSHDMRTPLTAAKMSAQILHKQVDKKLTRFTNRIISNMDRADAMIRDLLDASKIKVGEKVSLFIKDCYLNDICRATIEDLETLHGHRFVFDHTTEIHGFWDEEALRRIIENLANNAVKYGSIDSTITIKIIRLVTGTEISVHNTGSPISTQDQENLFQPYARSESAKQGSQQGWGIGLTLVRGFAEAMGGSVRVTSSKPLGTLFTISIPDDARVCV